MRITMLGNFRVPFCSEVHHAKTLEGMGHEVIKLQETEATSDQVLSLAMTSQMFVWIRTHGWNTPGSISMSDVLINLKNNGIPSVAYHLDLYMPIPDRWQEYEGGNYFETEHFFTVDKLMADWFNEHTEVKGHYIRAGVFEDECYMAEKQRNIDVVFVGSRGYHAEWLWRPQLVDFLRNTYGNRFEHYGGDGIKIIRGQELNQLYADAKVVVGDSLVLNFDYPYYWSDRVYETTGRGGFLLMPDIKGLETEFKYNEDIGVFDFGNFDGLKKQIDFYLTNDKLRETIRLNGHNKTKNNYSYTHRWHEILKTLELQ